MEIKPIRTEMDYQAALNEVESLLDSQPGTPQGDRLDVQVTLAEAYESQHFPIPEPEDPVVVLEYYMESRELTRTDLVPFLGSKERVSEVLNRKCGLSLTMSATCTADWASRLIYWLAGYPTMLEIQNRPRFLSPRHRNLRPVYTLSCYQQDENGGCPQGRKAIAYNNIN